MGNFSANGNDFAPLPEAIGAGLTLVQGLYHDTGKYGPPPMAGAPVNDRRQVTFPGIAGTVDVDHEFRHRALFATLILAGTLAYCHSACKTLLENLNTNTRYTIALPDGTTFDGCKLQDAGQGSFVNMNNGVLLILPCIFMQKSTTN